MENKTRKTLKGIKSADIYKTNMQISYNFAIRIVDQKSVK